MSRRPCSLNRGGLLLSRLQASFQSQSFPKVAEDAYRCDLDAIIAPTGSPAWPTDLVNGDAFLGGTSSFAAMAGYPLVTVPMGDAFGLPVGLTFMGRRWSEPTLIKLASGFEATLGAREAPRYLNTLPRT